MILRLGELTSAEAAEHSAGYVLVVPLGATEQHGPHLPLDTDTRIAVALVDVLAKARDDVVVAPPVPLGSSGEHSGFAGTLSIGQQALEVCTVELVRSADRWDGVVLVSGHGGNAEPLQRAVRLLRSESRDVLAWWPTLEGGDAHAGHVETSVMLALDPTVVRMERAEPGERRPLRDVMGALRMGGVGAVSPNGVLGDPTHASAAEGGRLFELMTGDLIDAVGRWRS